VEAVSIPVIGNGDVTCADDATRMFQQTGASGVMIGRAAQGNPWIFRELLSAWRGEPVVLPTPAERREVILKHMDLYVQSAGQATALREMRKHICWYAKGLPGASHFRTTVQTLNDLSAIKNAINDYFSELTAQEC